MLLLPGADSSFRRQLRRLLGCVMALEETSRELCRLGEGMAFWRHAAYAAQRVGGRKV